jgi:hypothetical protein
MVRGAYIQSAAADRLTASEALDRYITEVTPGKCPSSPVADRQRAIIIRKHLGKYSLAALAPEILAKFRDMRLANSKDVRAVQEQPPWLARLSRLNGE